MSTSKKHGNEVSPAKQADDADQDFFGAAELHDDLSQKLVEIDSDQKQKMTYNTQGEIKPDKYNQGLNEILEENEPIEHPSPTSDMKVKYSRGQQLQLATQTPVQQTRIFEMGNLLLNQQVMTPSDINSSNMFDLAKEQLVLTQEVTLDQIPAPDGAHATIQRDGSLGGSLKMSN